MNDLTGDEQDRSDMQRLAEGHDAALNDLMERYAQRLFHYVLRQLSNEDDANDITQEAFVKVYHNRTKFRAESKFSTWLYAITTNLVRDRLRWKQRHPETSLEAHEEEHQSLGEVLPDNSATPSEQMVAEERARQIRQAVQALPEDLRTPLILSEYENLSHAEIGTILSCTAKAVEMRIYRARQALRESLTKLLEA
jgi:RNA polymerase sigma-70 factor (ECF subfamily)